MTTASDAIWNRATTETGRSIGGPGDVALANLLRVHSLAMSGGLMTAVEGLSSDDVAAAVAGYRYFGLDEAATVVADLRAMLSREGLSDDVLEALEIEADRLYGNAIPTDQAIVDRFEARWASDPQAFSPA